MDERVKSDINSLVNRERKPTSLPVLPPADLIPSKRGVANGPASTGAGVASPLSEIGAENSREYFDATPVRVFSPDYMVAIEVQPLKTLRMTDANNEPVVMQFRNPFVME